MSNEGKKVTPVMDSSNVAENTTVIKNAEGELIIRLVREYGPASTPEEVIAFEYAILDFIKTLG